MPTPSLTRAFVALYVTVGSVVFIQSVGTVISAVRGTLAAGDENHALLLGGVETVAAGLFLVPGTLRIGADLLLGVFAVAFVLHAIEGEPALPLLVYGSAVLFVRAHGVGRSRQDPGTVQIPEH